MRQKVIKALRKEMRKDLQLKYNDFKGYMRTFSFLERARICLKLLFKP